MLVCDMCVCVFTVAVFEVRVFLQRIIVCFEITWRTMQALDFIREADVFFYNLICSVDGTHHPGTHSALCPFSLCTV